MVKYLGAIVLLIGALILIYAGINPSYDSNALLGVGISLTILGYLGHIFINRRIGDK